MYCRYCSSKIKDTDVFCSKCGNVIKQKQDNKKYLIIGMVSMACVLLSVFMTLFVFRYNGNNTGAGVFIATSITVWCIILLYQLIALVLCLLHTIKLKRHNKVISRNDKLGIVLSSISVFMSFFIICFIFLFGFIDCIMKFSWS